MSDMSNNLLKQVEGTSPKLDQFKLNNSKRRIKGICNSLKWQTNEYDPAKTAESIIAYIKDKNKLERLLYSEISCFVFALDASERGSFASNIEKLLIYSINDNDEKDEKDEDFKKVIIKIYDHFQLAQYQIENISNIFADGIEEAKDNLTKEIKGIEKEYISILGIFASIVLAFVGGITFSSSVLQNITEASIYRLVLVIDFLGFALANVIHMLINFILTINEKRSTTFKIKWLNIVFFVIAVLLMFAWLLNIHGLSGFINGFLPWHD